MAEPTATKTPEPAQKIKLAKHPTFLEHEPEWRKAHDVYEGTGGFMDPARPYLMPHPREWLDHSLPVKDAQERVIGAVPNPNPVQPSRKLITRRKIARYENIAEAILGSVFGALFRQQPARTFGKAGAAPTTAEKVRKIQQWYANTDGRHTTLDRAVADGWIAAAVFGHMAFLVEPASDVAETAADQGLPRLRAYTPLDIADWITDADGKLVAVRLLEAEPRRDFTVAAKPRLQVREVTETYWALYDSKYNLVEWAEHKMGRLPIALLYGRRRPLTPLIGKSIMGDPNNYIDLYNLHSEIRELLRNQTFAVLNVPIGPEGNVEEEQAKMGSQSGTANVVFSSQAISYVSPEGTNVAVYHETTDRLQRSIYRLAKAAWEGDSKVAESADSRRIKRDEQHQTLAVYAGECQRTDDELVELAYRAMHGADGWERAKQADEPMTQYPVEFTPSDVDEVVARVAEGIALDLGPTATKALKKATARQLLPGLSDKEFATIDAEIDGQHIQTAEEKQEALIKATAAKFGPRDDEDDDPDPAEGEDEAEEKGKAA